MLVVLTDASATCPNLPTGDLRGPEIAPKSIFGLLPRVALERANPQKEQQQPWWTHYRIQRDLLGNCCGRFTARISNVSGVPCARLQRRRTFCTRRLYCLVDYIVPIVTERCAPNHGKCRQRRGSSEIVLKRLSVQRSGGGDTVMLAVALVRFAKHRLAVIKW